MDMWPNENEDGDKCPCCTSGMLYVNKDGDLICDECSEVYELGDESASAAADAEVVWPMAGGVSLRDVVALVIYAGKVVHETDNYAKRDVGADCYKAADRFLSGREKAE